MHKKEDHMLINLKNLLLHLEILILLIDKNY